jgi:hypothetical protein
VTKILPSDVQYFVDLTINLCLGKKIYLIKQIVIFIKVLLLSASILFISDICFLRLDFETFNTVPVTAVETTSCPDQFKITVSANWIQTYVKQSTVS